MSPQARAPGSVWVLGAGLIGAYVGGRLAAAGVPVHFVGRTRMRAALGAGFTLTDLDDGRWQVPAPVWYDTLPAHAKSALVLLCVKSADTAQAAAQAAAVLPAGTPVLSLQNGVENLTTAQQAAPTLHWLAGMVPFNVSQPEPARLHQGTSGQLAAQDDPQLRAWVPAFAAAGLPLALHADLSAVQWAKLLLNLNNPINALSGLPLREQLLHAGWRRLTADLMTEGLQVLAAAGIAPAKLTPLPPHWLPGLMRLPTPLFRLAAARMLRIDAQARSSMAEDLALGREPEVDALCGALVRLGLRAGQATPRLQAVQALVLAERRALPLAQVQAALTPLA